jgi:hypothetical protein
MVMLTLYFGAMGVIKDLDRAPVEIEPNGEIGRVVNNEAGCSSKKHYIWRSSHDGESLRRESDGQLREIERETLSQRSAPP